MQHCALVAVPALSQAGVHSAVVHGNFMDNYITANQA